MQTLNISEKKQDGKYVISDKILDSIINEYEHLFINNNDYVSQMDYEKINFCGYSFYCEDVSVYKINKNSKQLTWLIHFFNEKNYGRTEIIIYIDCLKNGLTYKDKEAFLNEIKRNLNCDEEKFFISFLDGNESPVNLKPTAEFDIFDMFIHILV